MLGVRLDAETDRRLAAIARRQRRSKSDVAREALQTYIEREDDSAEFARQVRAIAEWEAEHGDDTADFLDAMAREMLDELDQAESSADRAQL